jgi:K+-sensing histidine kinase KdpD
MLHHSKMVLCSTCDNILPHTIKRQRFASRVTNAKPMTKQMQSNQILRCAVRCSGHTGIALIVISVSTDQQQRATIERQQLLDRLASAARRISASAASALVSPG